MDVYIVEVVVLPLPALLDPQGEAIRAALQRLSAGEVKEVRAGRAFHLHILAQSPEKALQTAHKAAQNLLYNPVVETYQLRLMTSSATT